MKCHKCPVFPQCVRHKQTVKKIAGVELDASGRYCPLATLIGGVFLGVMEKIEESKKVVKKAEGSKRVPKK